MNSKVLGFTLLAHKRRAHSVGPQQPSGQPPLAPASARHACIKLHSNKPTCLPTPCSFSSCAGRPGLTATYIAQLLQLNSQPGFRGVTDWLDLLASQPLGTLQRSGAHSSGPKASGCACVRMVLDWGQGPEELSMHPACGMLQQATGNSTRKQAALWGEHTLRSSNWAFRQIPAGLAHNTIMKCLLAQPCPWGWVQSPQVWARTPATATVTMQTHTWPSKARSTWEAMPCSTTTGVPQLCAAA